MDADDVADQEDVADEMMANATEQAGGATKVVADQVDVEEAAKQGPSTRISE